MKQVPGKVHHVTAADRGRTLAAFLRQKLGSASWGHVQKLVRSRHVMIHGNVCTDVARRLKDGEVVKVLDAAAAAPPKADDIRIVHLDESVVVVDKPAGVTTTRHSEERSWPARRRQVQPTLDEMVPDAIGRHLSRRQSGQAGRRRQPPVRPVHRIDRETSGLVVFARTVPAERILAEQFRAHATHRRYVAICLGRVNAGTIRTNLVRDRGDGRRGSSGTDSGKPSVTHVRPVEHLGDAYTVVECRLETGRTHQIRIHLAETGHPVCGERVYAAPRHLARPDDSRAPRVMLHAAELGFVHPETGAELRFESPLPTDMRRVLSSLRSRERTTS
ncbi:MAG: RluA family pseudouridine synthase [Planctomycetia bacterium]|nr:RluA family pseudouridine synthase [Planctomycetia bacterium]